jgi:TRAP-type C4-dicarboxylate transport system substrate-binding protein
VCALMSATSRGGSVTCMNRTLRTPLAAAALAAALLGLAACGNTPRVNKAGTASHAVTVITLQMPDGTQPDGIYFAQDVARRSGGTLKVVIDPTTYASTAPANEVKLVAALRAGRAGFSYQPARDWAVAGVAGFQALDTPFLVTTVQATDNLASGPVAGALLRQLTALGLVGLGLIPNEPRQFLSTRPLIARSDFDGARIRINDSPETAALVSAIGAHPVQGVLSTQVGGMLKSGSAAGVETSPMSILTNSYNREASYLTGYGLFPKFQTIVASMRAWRKLTAAQQAAMRQAAADTLAYAERTVASREQHELAGLCAGGLVLDEPSPAQLSALAHLASAAPAGPQPAAMVQMIKADVPGTGPRPSAVAPPAQCRAASTAAEAIALHGLSVRGGSGTSTATIPPGTYVTTDTVADWQAAGVADLPGSNQAITWTWHLYPNGTFYQTQQPDPGGQPFVRGRYTVKGDEVTFNSPTLDDNPETVRWSYYDGQLTFTIVNVQDPVGRVIYTAHPWRKVS